MRTLAALLAGEPAAFGLVTTLGAPVVALKRAPDLVDVDEGINPGADKKSVYVLAAGTLTADRVLTVTISGAPDYTYFAIVRYDDSAFTYTVKDHAGVTLFVMPASTKMQIMLFGFGAAEFFDQAWFIA